MNRKILAWVFFVFNSILFSNLSFSGEHDDVALFYDLLKNTHEHYEMKGSICEQVARKELEKTYPEPDFEIETGITYVDHGRVLGELDVVVFRTSDHKAILVGEVKCWRNLKKARKKAKKQMQRFLEIIQSHANVDLFLNDHKEIHYLLSQFEEIPTFVAISQKGGDTAGFNMTLGLTLDQLMDLRSQLLNTQR